MKIRAIVVVQPCPRFHISERTATYIIKVPSAKYSQGGGNVKGDTIITVLNVELNDRQGATIERNECTSTARRRCQGTRESTLNVLDIGTNL